jgi:hypothetical protein
VTSANVACVPSAEIAKSLIPVTSNVCIANPFGVGDPYHNDLRSRSGLRQFEPKSA